MAEEPHGEKTEEPTPKRLRDARRRGEVAQSRDLTGAAVLCAAVGALVAAGGHLLGEVTALFARSIPFATAAGGTDWGPVLADGLWTALRAIAPLLGAVVLAASVVSYLQVGAIFATRPIEPRLERLDPFAGAKRIFSVRGAIETLKATVKLVAVGAIGTAVVEGALADVVRTAGAPVETTVALVADLAVRLGATTGAAFAVIAALDLLYQRWRHRRDLRMTRHEVQREYRETEGDPRHRAERQRLHREILTHAMLEDVRKATVVVVNPEHVAVALLYEEGQEGAPRVVAKGERVLARQIIQIAREAGVPVVRNVPLAHALHRLELGEEIPEELYEAVAEVLRFVHGLAGQGRPESTES